MLFGLQSQSLSLLPLHLSNVSLDYIRLQLYGLDVIPTDKHLRMLAESQTSGGSDHHLCQLHVHIGVYTLEDTIVRFPILGLNEDLGCRP